MGGYIEQLWQIRKTPIFLQVTVNQSSWIFQSLLQRSCHAAGAQAGRHGELEGTVLTYETTNQSMSHRTPSSAVQQKVPSSRDQEFGSLCQTEPGSWVRRSDHGLTLLSFVSIGATLINHGRLWGHGCGFSSVFSEQRMEKMQEALGNVGNGRKFGWKKCENVISPASQDSGLREGEDPEHPLKPIILCRMCDTSIKWQILHPTIKKY